MPSSPDRRMVRTRLLVTPMRCRQCGWDCSLADRDLFSGKCSICEKMGKRKAECDPESVAARARRKHAEVELRRGVTPENVVNKLVSAGLDEAEARSLVEQAVADFRPVVEALRRELGLSEEASAVEVFRRARRAERARNRVAGLVAMGLGIVIILGVAVVVLVTRVLYIWVLALGAFCFGLGLLQSIFGFGIPD